MSVSREQNRGLDHLVDVARANDAVAAKKGVVNLVLARKGARMRRDGRPAALGPADLERDDPFAASCGFGCRFGETARVADRLEEKHDDADPVVCGDGAKIISGGARRLVARRYDVGEADVARVLAHRDRDRTAMRDERRRSCVQAGKRPRRPHADPIVHIDEARCCLARRRPCCSTALRHEDASARPLRSRCRCPQSRWHSTIAARMPQRPASSMTGIVCSAAMATKTASGVVGRSPSEA